MPPVSYSWFAHLPGLRMRAGKKHVAAAALEQRTHAAELSASSVLGVTTVAQGTSASRAPRGRHRSRGGRRAPMRGRDRERAARANAPARSRLRRARSRRSRAPTLKAATRVSASKRLACRVTRSDEIASTCSPLVSCTVSASEHRERVTRERGEGEDVGLQSRAAGRIGRSERQNDGWHELICGPIL